MLEAERRRRLRRADGSFVSDPPHWGRGGRLPKASKDCWRGRGVRLPGPGRAEARQSSATIAIGSAATTTTTTVGLAAANSTWGWSPPGVPAAVAITAVAAETAVAPLPGSLEGPGPQVSGAPFFLISLFNMPIGLNPSFACQGFLPLCSQGRALPRPRLLPPRQRHRAPGFRWGSGSSAANAKRCRSGGGGPHCSDGCHSLNDDDAVEYTVGSGRGGPSCAHPRH
jgi:hypothetical protein